MEIGANQFGAGCPTGPAMPPGRWRSLGRTGASPHSPDLQSVLSLYRQWHGGRGFVAGSIPAGVPDTRKLSFGPRRISDLDDQRHAKPADRPLPSYQAGPDYGFSRRCDAGGGEQRVGGTPARRASVVGRTERPSAGGADEIITGVARSSHLARFAAAGLRGDPANAGGAGRNSKIANQPRTHRAGTDFATNGSGAAIMRKREVGKVAVAAIEKMERFQKLGRSSI